MDNFAANRTCYRCTFLYDSSLESLYLIAPRSKQNKKIIGINEVFVSGMDSSILLCFVYFNQFLFDLPLLYSEAIYSKLEFDRD